VVYFFSSSSIPTSNFPGAQWNTPVAAGDAGGLEPNTGEALPGGGSSSGQESFAETPQKLDTTPNSYGHGLTPSPVDPSERINATFVTLARNSDIWEIAKSIRGVEDRFNRKYGYDWVFLNDDEFSDEFKKLTTALVSGKTHYGRIGGEHWGFPDFIDLEKARQVREDMKAKKIIYGDSISYRHMCRYESGFFFQHPIMLNFEYYWRVEPSIELYCDIDYDPFKFMKDNKKKYSFVLSLYEYVETIPTLWDSVKKFMKEHPEHIVADNSMQFLSDDGGDTYNHCHFVS
jgi:alpha 1,2-mannosyltransferase